MPLSPQVQRQVDEILPRQRLEREIEIQAQVLGELVTTLLDNDVRLPPLAAGWLMNQKRNPCLQVVITRETRRALDLLANVVEHEHERVIDMVELARQRKAASI